MKKPTIKNWIKYCAGIFAMSGMLLTTSCDSNDNQTADYENEVEAVENQPTTLERENVREDVAEVETEMEETETAAETTTNQMAQNQQASGDRSAGSMPNMDSHLEEYKEPNQAIREELTDSNDKVGSDTEAMGTEGMDRQNVTNTQGTTDYQQTDDMNRQGTTDTQGTGTDMNRESMSNTQGSYQYGTDTEQQNTTQQNNTLDNQQGTSNTTTGQESYQYGSEQQQTAQQDTATTQQDTNTYDRQSNTEMNQEDEYGTLIIERYSVIIPENTSAEDRQRMEGIMNEYNERRESMRGQMNPETGAYMSPEEEAQPRGMDYEQLINELENRIEYPQNALAAEMEGVVYVRFVVDENGQVRNAEAKEEVIVVPGAERATQPLNPTNFSENEIEETKEEMKQEAVRAVESTSGEWEAAMQGGQSVPMELQLPVHFRINDGGPVNGNR